MIEIKTKVKGFYKIDAVKADGSRRTLADWFPNLITNNGLNLIGSASNWLAYCQVGSGSSAPNVNDTGLASRVAGSNFLQTTLTGAQALAPYFVWRRNTYRFATGVATGNLSEVGVGPVSTNGLFSRALILDSFGSPTTISVAADETLDVTYEIRYYPPTEDNTFILNISGVDYDVTTRASSVTSSTSWVIGQSGTASTLRNNGVVYNGAIGDVTESPSGTSQGGSTFVNASYSDGSYQREGTITWPLNAGNLSGGVSAMRIEHGVGVYQLGFSPPIPKDATKVLSITCRHSWARGL